VSDVVVVADPLEARSPVRPPERSAEVAVSVLIPVLNEGEALEASVPSMLSQRLGARIEFIFAVGPCRDDSRERLERLAAADPRVSIVENPSGRTPDGLNIAFARARGSFIARMDAHAIYPPRYLADALARLRRGDAAWVSGPKRPRAHGGASGAVALALFSPLGQGPSRRFARRDEAGWGEHELDTGVFTGVWPRAALERHGTWDPRWLRNQDSELAARFLAAGERILSLESMTAEYLPRRTLRGLLRQYHQYGRYRARTIRRHRVARRRSHALAPALTAAVPVAALAPGPAAALARAALGAWAAAVSLETGRALADGARAADALRLPACFFCLHFGFGAGIWRGLAETLCNHRHEGA
jgi:succinoglycan biosynthesis protein ExoA